MHAITSNQDIRSGLARDYYAFISGEQMNIPPDLLADKAAFFADWPNLEPDIYLKDNSHFRFRRFNYYYFTPEKTGVRPFPPLPYYQSSAYNRYAGDVQRHFTPCTDAAKNNPFLHALIEFNFRQLPLEDERRDGPWRVETHQIRVLTNQQETGHPTPEGVHRDGVDFVFIYLINRHNIAGGESIINDDDGHFLHGCTLEQSMDALVVWDPKVYHGANPVLPENPDEEAYRDVLLVGFTYEPDLQPPATNDQT